ncbi:hypothetical protein COO60DRAFT_1523152 [Scenedesmus sp. NREL 46B-D3]|nr:hypothetical protein COO60DRAFT_1523152 [Scenedesmus sp. NREL 46B-D3]
MPPCPMPAATHLDPPTLLQLLLLLLLPSAGPRPLLLLLWNNTPAAAPAGASATLLPMLRLRLAGMPTSGQPAAVPAATAWPATPLHCTVPACWPPGATIAKALLLGSAAADPDCALLQPALLGHAAASSACTPSGTAGSSCSCCRSNAAQLLLLPMLRCPSVLRGVRGPASRLPPSAARHR